MSEDKYRVPILRLSDMVDDGSSQDDDSSDTVVTGAAWDSVPHSPERASLLSQPEQTLEHIQEKSRSSGTMHGPIPEEPTPVIQQAPAAPSAQSVQPDAPVESAKATPNESPEVAVLHTAPPSSPVGSVSGTSQRSAAHNATTSQSATLIREPHDLQLPTHADISSQAIADPNPAATHVTDFDLLENIPIAPYKAPQQTLRPLPSTPREVGTGHTTQTSRADVSRVSDPLPHYQKNTAPTEKKHAADGAASAAPKRGQKQTASRATTNTTTPPPRLDKPRTHAARDALHIDRSRSHKKHVKPVLGDTSTDPLDIWESHEVGKRTLSRQTPKHEVERPPAKEKMPTVTIPTPQTPNSALASRTHWTDGPPVKAKQPPAAPPITTPKEKEAKKLLKKTDADVRVETHDLVQDVVLESPTAYAKPEPEPVFLQNLHHTTSRKSTEASGEVTHLPIVSAETTEPEQASARQGEVATPHVDDQNDAHEQVSRLARLRDRVLHANPSRTKRSSSAGTQGAVKRKQDLVQMDLQALKEGSAILAQDAEKEKDGAHADQTAQITHEHAHVPETKHAKVIADVAKTLDNIPENNVHHSYTHAQKDEVVESATALTTHMPENHEDPTAATETGVEVPTEPAAQGLSNMRTFKQDAERAIKHNKTSVVGMIGPKEMPRDIVVRKARSGWFTPTAYTIAGVGLLLAVSAFLVLLWLYIPHSNNDTAIFALIPPDETVEYHVYDAEYRTFVDDLIRIRDEMSPSSGLIHIALIEHQTLRVTGREVVQNQSAHNFLDALTITPPVVLSGTLRDNFMLGVHSTNETVPFLIFEAKRTNDALLGMHDWETRLMQDLDPLFPAVEFIGPPMVPDTVPVPVAVVSTSSLAVSSTTATTTHESASSTDSAHATSSQATSTHVAVSTSTEVIPEKDTPVEIPAWTPPSFTDTEFGNIQARILRNTDNTPIIIWGVLDDRIIITTNESTMVELYTRMQRYQP